MVPGPAGMQSTPGMTAPSPVAIKPGMNFGVMKTAGASTPRQEPIGEFFADSGDATHCSIGGLPSALANRQILPICQSNPVRHRFWRTNLSLTRRGELRLMAEEGEQITTKMARNIVANAHVCLTAVDGPPPSTFPAAGAPNQQSSRSPKIGTVGKAISYPVLPRLRV